MTEPTTEIVVPQKPRRHRLRKLHKAVRGYVERGVVRFMHSSKDLRITGFQFICFLCGLYFVSYWSIPVAGVIGAAIAIVAAERQ